VPTGVWDAAAAAISAPLVGYREPDSTNPP